jgi:hypothetical protein
MAWAEYPCSLLCVAMLWLWLCRLDLKHADCLPAKVLVQSKNLIRLKGCLGPCLDDANTSKHLPLLGGLLPAVCCLYSGSEPIQESAGGGLSLSWLQHIVEATSPVKNKERR